MDQIFSNISKKEQKTIIMTGIVVLLIFKLVVIAVLIFNIESLEENPSNNSNKINEYILDVE